MAGTKLSGGTSSFNTYEYTVCSNDLKCKGDCMITRVNKTGGGCICLQQWDNGDTVPYYFTSQQTWEYEYFSDNYFTRVWWNCNQTADPYYIRFTGQEADGMFGYYVDSKYACPAQQQLSQNQNNIKDWKPYSKLSKHFNKNDEQPQQPEACTNGDYAACSYNGVCKNGKCEWYIQNYLYLIY